MTERGQGFARRITAASLGEFAPLLRPNVSRPPATKGEDRVGEAHEPPMPSPELAAALAKFQGKPIRIPSKRPRRRSSRAAVKPPVMATPAAPASPRRLVWSKRLVASDVHAQRGHATGGVRLTQAGFLTQQGRRINQTRYFREEVFGKLDWNPGMTRGKPREDAYASIRVIIQGRDLGVHRLRVGHKPSGEAGQRNYTTLLHWGPLGVEIASAQLVGSTLSLYAPTADGEPFLIEIV